MADVGTCALCPRLCRHACPVASGTAREAAVPSVIAEVLVAWRDGRVDDDLAREAATLCVDCGRCQEACHLHAPLPDVLRDARHDLGAAPPVPTGLEAPGEGEVVAALDDERDWSAALAFRLERTVAPWRVPPELAEALRADPTAPAPGGLGGRLVVAADGVLVRALRARGVEATSLVELLDEEPAHSCRDGGPCCGAALPLRAHHPEDAARLAGRFPPEVLLADARCARHLRAHGRGAADVVDRLLAEAP